MKKKRLLKRLAEEFPEYSEKELFAAVMCGDVLVGGERIRDSKAIVNADVPLELARKKYVSRGGFKLEKVLELWDLPVQGARVLDAGSSTGGFTDCLLQKGALSVYAVDVGYNQLDYSLRTNPAVVVMERTNIMAVDSLEPPPDWAVADLSFRSLRSAARHILDLTLEHRLIALMKPQFELEEPDEDFDGIIRDPELILEIAGKVMNEMAAEGAYVRNAALSPVTGRKGNQELLFDISSDPDRAAGPSLIIDRLRRDFGVSRD